VEERARGARRDRGRRVSSLKGVERRFRAEAQRWDEIYSDAGTPWGRAWDRWTRDNVRRRFARTFERAGDLTGKSVLDVGCGSGRYLVEALARGAGKVVGIDLAAEMVETARTLVGAQSDRVELWTGDLMAYTPGTRFDLVIANGLFDYLDAPGPALSRIHAWTGGLVVATFPDRRAPRALPRSLYWRTKGVRIRLYDEGSIRALAATAGLGAVEIERIGPIYLLAARA
jgi:SAM-dependent methyltransferase